MSKRLISAFCLAGTMALCGTAYAKVISVAPLTTTACNTTSINLLDQVPSATGCLISSATQDFRNIDPWTVNAGQGFFNINNWLYGGNATEGSLSSIAKFTQEFSQNEWSGGKFNFLPAGLSAEDVMFVFKSGNDNSGATLVAYLFDPAAGVFNYGNPFREPAFDFPGGSTTKAISHISVYYREGGGGEQNEIPEPGSVALLGLGVLGMMSLRRKQRAKQ